MTNRKKTNQGKIRNQSEGQDIVKKQSGSSAKSKTTMNNQNKTKGSSTHNNSSQKTNQAKGVNPKKQKKKKSKLTVFKYISYILIILFLAGVSTVGLIMYSAFKDIGDINVNAIREKISTPSIVYDSNGEKIGEFKSSEGRVVSKFEDIPQDLKNAVMAIEDSEFYNHKGFNLKRTLGALMYNIKVGYSAQGGSTLTQQLVKNVFLTNEKTIDRKVKELCYSLLLEQKLSKDEIFEAYLNTIYLGKGSYGVASAALNYFNKDIKDLDLAECALLAGITKYPTKYDAYKAVELSADDNLKDVELVFYPLQRNVSEQDKKMYGKLLELGKIDDQMYKALMKGDKTVFKAVFNPESKKRQEVVLKRMLTVGSITEEQYNKAKNEKIVIDVPEPSKTEISSYFIDYIKDDLIKILVEQGYTKQEAIEILYNRGLQIYTTLDTEMQKKTEEQFNNPNNYPYTRYNSQGIPQPQGAMVIMDYRNGYIRTMVGGRNIEGSNLYNRSISPRQPGSTIKPIAAYIPALMRKILYPNTIVDDSPMTYGGKTYPNNYMHQYRGDITATEAVAHSSNVVAARTLLKLEDTPKESFRASIDFMRELGITSLVDRTQNPSHHDENLPLVLGGLSKGISPLEMAGAYGAIANKGVYIKPTAVVKVLDLDGKVIYEHKITKKRVFSEQVAYLMTDMLEAVVDYGSGTPARSTLGIQTVGKTGTTSNNKDGWFVGYTPYYVASTWLGADMPTEISQISRYAVRLWGKVLNIVQQGYDPIDIYSDTETKEVTICSETEMLATKKCKKLGKAVKVRLLKGNAPTKECSKHEYTEYDAWLDEQARLEEERKKQEELENAQQESSDNSSDDSSSSSSNSSSSSSNSSNSSSDNSSDNSSDSSSDNSSDNSSHESDDGGDDD